MIRWQVRQEWFCAFLARHKTMKADSLHGALLYEAIPAVYVCRPITVRQPNIFPRCRVTVDPPGIRFALPILVFVDTHPRWFQLPFLFTYCRDRHVTSSSCVYCGWYCAVFCFCLSRSCWAQSYYMYGENRTDDVSNANNPTEQLKAHLAAYIFSRKSSFFPPLPTAAVSLPLLSCFFKTALSTHPSLHTITSRPHRNVRSGENPCMLSVHGA